MDQPGVAAGNAGDAVGVPERHSREAASVAPVLIRMSDTSAGCIWFNAAWLQFTGRTAEQELGDGWTDGLHAEDRSRCLDAYRAALDRREAFRIDYRLRRHDGAYRCIEDNGVPRFAPDGAFAGFVGSCVDVTEQRAAEARFRGVFDSDLMGLAIVALDPPRVLAANDRFVALTGCARADVAEGRCDWRRASVDELRGACDNALVQALSRGWWDTYETQYHTCNGARRPVRVSSAPLPGEQGQLVMSVQDISDEHAAVAARVDAELGSQLAVQGAQLGTWDFHVQSGDLVWNDRCRELFGLAPGTPVSFDRFLAGVHPDDRQRMHDIVAAAAIEGGPETIESEYRTVGLDDGTERWLVTVGRALSGPGGRRLSGVVLDITERKRNEAAIGESEQRFRAIADSAPALIWMTDEHIGLTFANKPFRDYFGAQDADLLGDGWRRVMQPEHAPAFMQELQAVFDARRPLQMELAVFDGHGRRRWLQCNGVRRFDDNGRFLGYTGTNLDVTDSKFAREELERRVAERTAELATTNGQLLAQIAERERVEDTLFQLQRLDAVGQLTSGVAHDFNNLLTVIAGNLYFVESAIAQSDCDEKLLQRIDNIRVASERGAKLTTQLLAFARRQRLEAKTVDLNDTIARTRDLIRSSMGGAMQVLTVAADDLWAAQVDTAQFELVLLNLAINARDAMQVGGTLTLSTANVICGEPLLPGDPQPGAYVRVSVSDTGEGMAPDVIAHAFEPFFTTKEVGEGSGLGLAQVYGFAKQSCGGVRIESTVGEGTTVSVFLPRSPDAGPTAAEAIASARARDAIAGNPTLLLVDDDDIVREITGSVLEDIGCRVLLAPSGQAALQVVATEPGIQLLILDFAMPGMNGAEVARAVRATHPQMPILFVTGYADIEALSGVPREDILQKPYRRQDLSEQVRRLLGQ